MGYGEITDDDLTVLVEAADADGDGKISLEDFRGMMRFAEKPGNASALASGGSQPHGSSSGAS